MYMAMHQGMSWPKRRKPEPNEPIIISRYKREPRARRYDRGYQGGFYVPREGDYRDGIGGRSRHSRRRSRSHSRPPSRFLSWDCSPIRNLSEHHKHVAGAGLIGEPTAGLFERVEFRSPSRGGEPGRSHSRPRKSLPIVGAGLGTTAVT
ncbi:hypothetical protein N7499_001536 [Penicillium canescens]|nr:hypothetical protein N7522_013878 [Penicillium canescens]KAJ6097162.1 hypothetical protein N7499_001536 [Penicillium canescens]KAJ6165152.1 hypothetical protein N7485_008396 [Penicillium canescens]